MVLNWNGWRDTITCLASIKATKYPNYKTLLIDNGSTDSSVEKIRAAFPSVEILETGENLGFAGGNNLGIKIALDRGAEYIWLLNNDTVVSPEALTSMVEVAQSDARIGAVGSVIYHMEDETRLQAWGGGRIYFWLGITRVYRQATKPELLDYIVGASLLVKAEALRDVGCLDSDMFMYWEDTDFCVRLRRQGWKLEVAPAARVWHKESAALGKYNPELYVHFNTSAVKFFKKHYKQFYVPILVGGGGRFLKRLGLGDWKLARAVLQGLLSGWKQ